MYPLIMPTRLQTPLQVRFPWPGEAISFSYANGLPDWAYCIPAVRSSGIYLDQSQLIPLTHGVGALIPQRFELSMPSGGNMPSERRSRTSAKNEAPGWRFATGIPKTPPIYRSKRPYRAGCNSYLSLALSPAYLRPAGAGSTEGCGAGVFWRHDRR